MTTLNDYFRRMQHIEENTTLVGATELRTKMKEILKAMKVSKVVLEMRNKALAVLVPIDKYKKIEALLEEIEDRTLGYVARGREKRARERDYLSLDQLEKKLGLR